MENFQHITTFIWNVADDVLRDDFKRSKYPDVILPFTVVRRIDCVLAPTKENVLKRYTELKDELQNLDGILKHESGYAFYNVSKYDFKRLLDDPENIHKNLIDYINGFSENARDILDRFKSLRVIYDPQRKLWVTKTQCMSHKNVCGTWVTHNDRTRPTSGRRGRGLRRGIVFVQPFLFDGTPDR
ncbi:MAG: type I restriction-modification system subunit M N-terminal domain-containing protein [Methanomicrobiales archaeon]